MFKHWFRRCTFVNNEADRPGGNCYPEPCEPQEACHPASHCASDSCCPGVTAPLNRKVTLDCLKLNETGEIDVVPDEALLKALGFRPGKRVCLRCRARFGGPVVAEIEGRHTALARDLARQIHLKIPAAAVSGV